ncbi:MAG: CHAD domain-containing protein [Microbacterium sp.]
MTERETAGEAVTRMLRTHVVSLRVSEGPLRRDEDDAVHQTRIVVRRLRSILKEYRDVLDRSAAKHWRRRLKAWGDALGEVRDAEVRARDGQAVLARLPAAAWDGLSPLIVEPALDSYRAGHEALLERMRSTEHLELLRELELFADAPALGDLAELPATNTIGDLLVGTARDLAEHTPSPRDVRAIRREPEPALAQLHALRKAARRLRYAAEAAIEVGALRPRARHRARRLAARAMAVQNVLGDHRDAVLFACHVEGGAAAETRPLVRIAQRSRASARRTITQLRRDLALLWAAGRALGRA